MERNMLLAQERLASKTHWSFACYKMINCFVDCPSTKLLSPGKKKTTNVQKVNEDVCKKIYFN